jgi:hypothetical protein
VADPPTERSPSIFLATMMSTSPSAAPVLGYGDISTRLLNFEDSLEGLGILTPLYRYQRLSVAEMIEREREDSDVTDPLFNPLRGGILCEELGTYETLLLQGITSP